MAYEAYIPSNRAGGKCSGYSGGNRKHGNRGRKGKKRANR